MNSQWPPSPSSVLADLEPLLDILRPALVAASDHAVRFFEQAYPTDEHYDPWLFAHLARENAKRRLVVDDIGSLGYDVGDLPLSGLFLSGAEYQIRILKAEYGLDSESGALSARVPGSQSSSSRKEYFYQPPLEFLLPGFHVQRPLKLIVLWDVGPEYQLSLLELACPRAWDATRNCVNLYWNVPIPLPEGVIIPPFLRRSSQLEDLELPPLMEEEAADDSSLR